MVNCSVYECTSNHKRKDESIKFFSFPKDENLQRQWINACNPCKNVCTKKPKNINTRYARICSLHFLRESWSLKDQMIPSKNIRLKDDAVPTLKLPNCINIAQVESQLEHIGCKNLTVQEEIKQNSTFGVEENSQTDWSSEEKFEINIKTEPTDPVQCQPEVEGYSSALKIMQLQKKNSILVRRLAEIRKHVGEAKNLEISLRRLFTDGQIRRLKHPKKRLKWQSTDILAAKAIYSINARGYRFLYRKKYPLPRLSTIRKWAEKNQATSPSFKPHQSRLD